MREFALILGWLRENIHVHGAKFEPQELVEKVTGSKITPGPLCSIFERISIAQHI